MSDDPNNADSCPSTDSYLGDREDKVPSSLSQACQEEESDDLAQAKAQRANLQNNEQFKLPMQNKQINTSLSCQKTNNSRLSNHQRESHCSNKSQGGLNQNETFDSKSKTENKPVKRDKKDFLTQGDPLPLVKHGISMKADIVFGWKPKAMEGETHPIPLCFDLVSYDLESYPQQDILYIGPRYANSYKMHESLANKIIQTKYKIPESDPVQFYSYQTYSFVMPKLASVMSYTYEGAFQKFAEAVACDSMQEVKKHIPCYPKQGELKFNSEFEQGNLDFVAKSQEMEDEFDLILRLDSNSRSHQQWFYFSVEVPEEYKNRKVRFSILNLTKPFSLYQQGMMPVVWSDTKYNNDKVGWHRAGTDIKYKLSKLIRTSYGKTNFQLSFDYTFEYVNDKVYFAYSIPYTFTMLNNFLTKIQSIQDQPENKQSVIFKKDVFCKSLSGIEIPIVTITDFSESKQKKKTILMQSRIHPGETHASWVVHGLIRFLLSTNYEAKQLRKRCVFKIIPMMNVDGVIMGNYRASFAGCDMNRQFGEHASSRLNPETTMLKEIALKQERLAFFFDVHSHSSKKSIFMYGPHFPLHSEHYLKNRVLPKLVQDRTVMFRYYSCRFANEKSKRNCGRLALSRIIDLPSCYTIEVSMMGYIDRERQTVIFGTNSLQYFGDRFAIAILDWFQILEHHQREKIKKAILLSKKRSMSKKKSVVDFLGEEDMEEFKEEIHRQLKENLDIQKKQGLLKKQKQSQQNSKSRQRSQGGTRKKHKSNQNNQDQKQQQQSSLLPNINDQFQINLNIQKQPNSNFNKVSATNNSQMIDSFDLKMQNNIHQSGKNIIMDQTNQNQNSLLNTEKNSESGDSIIEMQGLAPKLEKKDTNSGRRPETATPTSQTNNLYSVTLNQQDKSSGKRATSMGYENDSKLDKKHYHNVNHGFYVSAFAGFEYMEYGITNNNSPNKKKKDNSNNPNNFIVEEDVSKENLQEGEIPNIRRLDEIYQDIKKDIFRCSVAQTRGSGQQLAEEELDSDRGHTTDEEDKEAEIEESRIQNCLLSFFENVQEQYDDDDSPANVINPGTVYKDSTALTTGNNANNSSYQKQYFQNPASYQHVRSQQNKFIPQVPSKKQPCYRDKVIPPVGGGAITGGSKSDSKAVKQPTSNHHVQSATGANIQSLNTQQLASSAPPKDNNADFTKASIANNYQNHNQSAGSPIKYQQIQQQPNQQQQLQTVPRKEVIFQVRKQNHMKFPNNSTDNHQRKYHSNTRQSPKNKRHYNNQPVTAAHQQQAYMHNHQTQQPAHQYLTKEDIKQIKSALVNKNGNNNNKHQQNSGAMSQYSQNNDNQHHKNKRVHQQEPGMNFSKRGKEFINLLKRDYGHDGTFNQQKNQEVFMTGPLHNHHTVQDHLQQHGNNNHSRTEHNNNNNSKKHRLKSAVISNKQQQAAQIISNQAHQQASKSTNKQQQNQVAQGSLINFSSCITQTQHYHHQHSQYHKHKGRKQPYYPVDQMIKWQKSNNGQQQQQQVAATGNSGGSGQKHRKNSTQQAKLVKNKHQSTNNVAQVMRNENGQYLSILGNTRQQYRISSAMHKKNGHHHQNHDNQKIVIVNRPSNNQNQISQSPPVKQTNTQFVACNSAGAQQQQNNKRIRGQTNKNRTSASIAGNFLQVYGTQSNLNNSQSQMALESLYTPIAQLNNLAKTTTEDANNQQQVSKTMITVKLGNLSVAEASEQTGRNNNIHQTNNQHDTPRSAHIIDDPSTGRQQPNTFRKLLIEENQSNNNEQQNGKNQQQEKQQNENIELLQEDEQKSRDSNNSPNNNHIQQKQQQQVIRPLLSKKFYRRASQTSELAQEVMQEIHAAEMMAASPVPVRRHHHHHKKHRKNKSSKRSTAHQSIMIEASTASAQQQPPPHKHQSATAQSFFNPGEIAIQVLNQNEESLLKNQQYKHSFKVDHRRFKHEF